MTLGDIILVPFPYADLTTAKVRPAVVVTHTKDKYEDIVLSAISSVVPSRSSEYEIIVAPTRLNKLRARSVIKVDRLATLRRENVVGRLGKLSPSELQKFKQIFRNLVE
jgi:mRNA interferase MazF